MSPLAVPMLLAFALQAQGDDYWTLGRDNAEFARALFRAGFTELAENLCTKIENSASAEPDEVASVRSVHLDLKIEQARTRTDPRQKLTELSQLLKAKEEFIDAYPDAPEAEAAQQTLPDVYAAVGEAYADALKAAVDDPDEGKRLRNEGIDVFRRGEQQLADQVEALSAAAEDQSLSEPDLERVMRELMTAKYNLARTYYFHATLLGSGDPFGKTFMERSADAFGEFGLEFGDSLLYYEGLVFQGLANKALGLTDDALFAFDSCIALRDTFAQGEDMPDVTVQVIAWGVEEKMALLSELKQHDEAIATANDFLATVPAAARSRRDLAILDARMQAEMQSGDTATAQKTAALLVEKDERGYYGRRGQDVLGELVVGGGAAVDQKNVLKIAQSLASKKDFEQAIRLCNQAIAGSRASGKPGEDLAEAFILAGACYWSLGQFEEASIAYDAAAQSNPSAKKVPDALYSASQTYRKLFKERKQAFFEKRADERLEELARRYPDHPKAASQLLSKAEKLEANDDFEAAAEEYLRVSASSSVYPDAQFRAGIDLYEAVKRLPKEQAAEAKAGATKTEAQLRKAQKVLETAAGKTLDLDEKARFERNASQALNFIGELYMLETVGRQADVIALAQEIEEKYAADEDKVGDARSLRVRALTAVGKVKEAEEFLEGLLAGDPNSRSTALAAGVLARTFDQQAADAFAKDSKSEDGDDLWKQAYRYYVISLTPKLEDPSAAEELEKVANRLLFMGEHFNAVPAGATSFVALAEHRAPVAPEYWESAARFFESAVSKSGSFKGQFNLARTYGYLGRFEEARDLYAQIVETESLIDPSTNEINRPVLGSRPELMSVYLELGGAMLELGKAENDTNQVSDAATIFEQIVKAAPRQTSEAWWRARYLQIEAWNELGRYPQAAAAIRDLERTTTDFDDGKYGLNVRFKELKREVERKIVNDPKPAPAPAPPK